MPTALLSLERSLPATSQGNTPRRANNLPTVPQILQSAPWVACLPAFSPRAAQRPQGSIPVQPTTFKTLKAHGNQPLLFSQPIALGKCSPCVVPCVFLSHFSLSRQLPLLCSTHDLFLPQTCLCTPTFLDVVSFLPVVMEFVLSVFRLTSGAFRVILQLSRCV